jgi:DNA polymerase-4
LTCRDVRQLSLRDLRAKVGNMAEWLYDGARGLDARAVEASRMRKSMGHEETFAKDILDVAVLKWELAQIAESVAQDLQDEELRARTITLKVRYDDFTRITRSQSLPFATNERELIAQLVEALLGATEAGKRRIRLLGVTASNFD